MTAQQALEKKKTLEKLGNKFLIYSRKENKMTRKQRTILQDRLVREGRVGGVGEWQSWAAGNCQGNQ